MQALCVRRWNLGAPAPATPASLRKLASCAGRRLVKNSPSRFDTLWLFYLGEPAAPRLIGELRYLQLTRGVSLTYAKSWIESGCR
jgi:hypothetical protein